MILLDGTKVNATIDLKYNHGYMLCLMVNDGKGYPYSFDLIDYSKLKIETCLEYTYLEVKSLLSKESLHDFIESSNLTRSTFTDKLIANADNLDKKGFNFFKDVIDVVVDDSGSENIWWNQSWFKRFRGVHPVSVSNAIVHLKEFCNASKNDHTI